MSRFLEFYAEDRKTIFSAIIASQSWHTEVLERKSNVFCTRTISLKWIWRGCKVLWPLQLRFPYERRRLRPLERPHDATIWATPPIGWFRKPSNPSFRWRILAPLSRTTFPYVSSGFPEPGVFVFWEKKSNRPYLRSIKFFASPASKCRPLDRSQVAIMLRDHRTDRKKEKRLISQTPPRPAATLAEIFRWRRAPEKRESLIKKPEM